MYRRAVPPRKRFAASYSIRSTLSLINAHALNAFVPPRAIGGQGGTL
jgi:hypothetical protein